MIKLVSVHVPKTAGTSFRDALSRVYGRGSVHLTAWTSDEEMRDGPQGDAVVPAGAQVVHGHVFGDQYTKFLHADMITWVRNPVTRVLSHWRHVRRSSGISLDDFLVDSRYTNLMSRMIGSSACYRFIGVYEHLDEDFEGLCKMMNWPHEPLPRKNVGGEKDPVSEEDVVKIIETNYADMDFYLRALRRRRKWLNQV